MQELGSKPRELAGRRRQPAALGGSLGGRWRRLPPLGWPYSEALAIEGALVFAKAREFGLEGIVSKRAGSRYRSGPSRSWLKTKNPNFVRT